MHSTHASIAATSPTVWAPHPPTVSVRRWDASALHISVCSSSAWTNIAAPHQTMKQILEIKEALISPTGPSPRVQPGSAPSRTWPIRGEGETCMTSPSRPCVLTHGRIGSPVTVHVLVPPPSSLVFHPLLPPPPVISSFLHPLTPSPPFLALLPLLPSSYQSVQ